MVPQLIQVQNTMHLTGHADGSSIRMTAEQLLNQFHGPLQYYSRTLEPLPGLPRNDGCIVHTYDFRSRSIVQDHR